MQAALIPLLFVLAAAALVAVMTVLFFQFSQPGKRKKPAIIIAFGVALGALLFVLKIKLLAIIAGVIIVAIGYIYAFTESPSLPDSK